MLITYFVPDMQDWAQLSWTKSSLPCLRLTVLLRSSMTLVVIHALHAALTDDREGDRGSLVAKIVRFRVRLFLLSPIFFWIPSFFLEKLIPIDFLVGELPSSNAHALVAARMELIERVWKLSSNLAYFWLLFFFIPWLRATCMVEIDRSATCPFSDSDIYCTAR